MATFNNLIIDLIGLNAQGDLGPVTIYKSQRGRRIWFAKAPPEIPWTVGQIRQRTLFIMAGIAWQNLTADEKADYERAAKKASLRITGYNLWVHACVTQNVSYIETIIHQTAIALKLPQTR